jgi:hypothetical protein
MTINADMSNSGGMLVEQGVYPCTVTDVEQKISTNTGGEYVAFEFTIAGGEFKGKKLWLNNSLGAKDRNYYLRQTLQAISGEEVPEVENFSFEESAYVGRGCMVQVVHEERKGKVYATVAGITPSGTDPVDLTPGGSSGAPDDSMPW